MINTLVSDMLGNGVWAYLGHFLVCDKDVETHLANLEPDLIKRRDAGLRVKVFFSLFFFAYGLWHLEAIMGPPVLAQSIFGAGIWCFYSGSPLAHVASSELPSHEDIEAFGCG